MSEKLQVEFGGRSLSIETGKVAKQANGSVVVQYGETVVLVTAVTADKRREGLDFIPLTVNYQEMTYAAGKIPGGFFKRREGPLIGKRSSPVLSTAPSGPSCRRAFRMRRKLLPPFSQQTKTMIQGFWA